MKAPRISMLCRHCGKQADFQVCTEYETQYLQDFEIVERDGTSSSTESLRVDVTWRLLQCWECHRPTLEEDYNLEFMDEVETAILYPQEEKPKEPLANLPDPVQKAYDAALKVRAVEPNAYAVLLGRALEAACKHEQAKGRTLADMLKALADSGRIPRTLARMAEQVKEFRNLGAHADDRDEVTEQDVPAIEEFVEAILEYLYIAPAKIAAVEARLKQVLTP